MGRGWVGAGVGCETLREPRADLEIATISGGRARRLCAAVLRGRGAPGAHAATQTRLLVEADLRGRPSHGLQRLPVLVARIDRGLLAPAATPELAWRSTGFLHVDGGDGFGAVAAQAAIAALCQRSSSSGVALAAIARSSHVGMLALYLEEICARGNIGIALTTSEALVHPIGGRTALVGTNPLGIGIPAEPEPFILDMSTAAISAGEIIAHAQRGVRLPPGRAVDPDGVPTTDPQQALAGAISPFGGAKGYGLGLGLELLVALLSRTALGTAVLGTLDIDHSVTKGDALLVIDPRACGLPDPAAYLADYLRELRDAPTAPGVEQILIPGDRMRAERARRLREGIEYPQPLWRELLELERDARASNADAFS